MPRLLLAALLVLSVACTQTPEPPPEQPDAGGCVGSNCLPPCPGGPGCEPEFPSCTINGVEYMSGQSSTAESCLRCEPERSKTDWTPQPDGTFCPGGECASGSCRKTCEWDGSRFEVGARLPGEECRGCVLSASGFPQVDALPDGTTCGGGFCRSGTCTGGCFIAGEVHGADMPNLANLCETCDPARSTTAWSTAADGSSCAVAALGGYCAAGTCTAGCLIEGNTYAIDDGEPGNECRVCAGGTFWSARTEGTGCGADPDNQGCSGAGTCVDRSRRFELRSLGGAFYTFYAVFGTGSSEIFAGGFGGLVRSTNGGENWTAEQITLGGSERITGLSGAGGTYFAVTNSNVFTSPGGGTGWTAASALPDGTGVWAASASDVFVTTSTGSIVRSTNGGTTFLPSGTSPSSRALRSVWGTSASDVYAVGDAGTVLHWNGTDWEEQTTPTTKNLLVVRGSSATDVWAAGQDGTVLHTNNGGATWVDRSPGRGGLLASLTVADDGVYIGGQSQVFWSADGGAYWREQRHSLEGLISAGWSHGRLVIFADGNGRITRTTD